MSWQIWLWWFRGRNIPALVAECTCSVQSLSSWLKLLMEVAWQQSAELWTGEAGAAPHSFVLSLLWLWDGGIGSCRSQGLPGRALSNSSGPGLEVKAVMLTHAEVVRSGKPWKSYVASHFKMLWSSQNVFLASKPEQSCCRALLCLCRVNRHFTGHSFQCKLTHTLLPPWLSRTAPLSAEELAPMVVWDYQWNSLSEEILWKSAP